MPAMKAATITRRIAPPQHMAIHSRADLFSFAPFSIELRVLSIMSIPNRRSDGFVPLSFFIPKKSCIFDGGVYSDGCSGCCLSEVMGSLFPHFGQNCEFPSIIGCAHSGQNFAIIIQLLIFSQHHKHVSY